MVVLEVANTESLENANKHVDSCDDPVGELIYERYTYYLKNRGPILSLLMVMIWTLCVLKEFRHISDFMMAIWNLPRGTGTKLTVNDRTRKIMIVEISTLRLAVANFSACTQFAVASCLLVVGSTWLASTVALTDLLLNGVALQFIMEIDELVFYVFCSTKIKTITTSLQPLMLPARLVLPNRVSVRAVMSLAAWILFVVVIVITCLRPNFRHINDVVEFQCAFDNSLSVTTTLQPRPH